MATTSIPWNDGTSDKITFSYTASEGDQTVLVTSDPNNTYLTREKSITFATVGGASTATLRVIQTAADLIVTTDNDVVTSDSDVVLGDTE